ncbi:MAG: circularly permuted type 2 ATP-grasp protein [Alphaproteobacteria bacterium]|nr:circularly permuted type 2 ATP-grasp protein [Alphaproteobacteria bacterium]
MVDGAGGLRPHWRSVLGAYAALTDGLAERARRLDRAVAEEGVAALLPSAGDPVSPWRCDPLPLPLPGAEFASLAAGLDQRARLLEAVLADLFGPQRLLAEGLVPPALVFANSSFLRPCRDLGGGVRLHFYAADLIRAPDGAWTVTSDRTDGAAGLGLARENRRLLARVLPEPFRPVQVRPLRPFFELWQEGLHRLAPPGRGNPSVALLSEGATHPYWFEHMLLARELGAALVEPGDLTVRNGAVFLKTLRGLQPVDVLIRRLAGRLLDPLELDSGPLAGVPGLLDAVRAGSVRIVNDPASAMLEAPGFAALLPGLAERLLGEPLQLANAAPGEPASVAPWLVGEGLEPRPVVLRLYLVHDGEGWRAMPGGLARMLTADAPEPAQALAGGALPGGGVAKDVWVLAEERADVIGLEELAADQAIAIERDLADLYPHQTLHPLGIPGKGVISRFPIRSAELIDLYPDRPDLLVRIEAPHGLMRVIVAHPPPPRFRRSGLRFDQQTRVQIDALVELAASDGPTILMGDFNAPERHRSLRQIAGAGFIDAFKTAGEGEG